MHLLTPLPFLIFQAECLEIIPNFALVGDVVYRMGVDLQKGEALRIPAASSLKTLPCDSGPHGLTLPACAVFLSRCRWRRAVLHQLHDFEEV